jgi:MOSC domain-containing protein YiiM
MAGQPRVAAVSLSRGHSFSKTPQMMVRLVAGVGVEGDAHAGATVRHRSRVARDPTQANLRQVHLIGEELFAELAEKGFTVGPGDVGENVTTAGIDLLALPRGTRLRLGGDAVIEITGLRNPCGQLNGFAPGLLEATLERRPEGLVRKAGVMAVVLEGGDVRPDDPIAVALPALPHHALERV